MADNMEEQEPAAAAEQPVQETPPATIPQPAEATPDMAQAAPATPMQPKTTDQMAQEMTAHDLEFQQDLAMGKIQPKTYKDLYDAKGTMGKIGTLFGLLVGGAGAGLEHQPSALLGMMDKEIERNIEAQKQSKGNAENWYKLHRAHELQKYQQELMQQQTLAGAASTYANSTAGDLNVAKINQLGNKVVDIRATNSAKNTYMLMAAQQQQDMINKMPPGPARDAAQAALSNQLAPAIAGKIDQNNKDTANKVGLINTLGTMKNPAAGTGQAKDVDYDKIRALRDNGRKMTNNGLTPDFGEKEYDAAMTQGSLVEHNRRAAKIFHDAFAKLASQPLGGTLNKRDYDNITQTAQSKIDQLLGTGSKIDVKNLFPTWSDIGGNAGRARRDKYEDTMNLFEQNEVTPIFETYKKEKLKSDFPKFPSPFPDEKGREDGGKRDKTVEQYAKTYKLDYDKALQILTKRGHKVK